MREFTQHVIVARSDETGSERIAAEHRYLSSAEAQRRSFQLRANCAGAAVTYRVIRAVDVPAGLR